MALPPVLVELFKNIDFPLDTGNCGAAGFCSLRYASYGNTDSGCGIAAWLVGILGDRIGMTPAFFLVPVSYGMILLILSLQKKSAADK